mgnify:CR=1 FL=1
MIKKMVLLMILLFSIPCSSSSSSSENNVKDLSNKTMALEALEQINAYRKSLNKTTLEWDDEIYQIALEHTNYMVAKGKISHDNFEDRSQRLFKLNYTSVGENVAWNNYPDPVSTAVTGWINSSGHRANIEGDFNKTAIAVVVKDGQDYYFTQIFAKK